MKHHGENKVSIKIKSKTRTMEIMETLDTFFIDSSRIIMKPTVKKKVSESPNVRRKIAHVMKRAERETGQLNIYCR